MEEDELDEPGCLFGDECCMAGLHLKSECVSTEMMEAYFLESESD